MYEMERDGITVNIRIKYKNIKSIVIVLWLISQLASSVSYSTVLCMSLLFNAYQGDKMFLMDSTRGTTLGRHRITPRRRCQRPSTRPPGGSEVKGSEYRKRPTM